MEAKIVAPPHENQNALYFAGLALLSLNYFRHTLMGYRTPRTFPMSEFKRASEYDCDIVDHWMSLLKHYSGKPPSLDGKRILELSPGADLGIGLLTLFKGAQSYTGIDIVNLVQNCPREFYDVFLEHIAATYEGSNMPLEVLRDELEQTLQGKGGRLKYIHSSTFDLATVQEGEIDLVVSNGAFNCFDDVGKTVSQLSKIVRKGAIFIACMDTSTTTRWIRDRDPLNIYRYGEGVYNLFRFLGSQNRVRPYRYKEILAENEWHDIEIVPNTKVDRQYLAKVQPHLDPAFQGDYNQMDYLSVAVCATRN